ncbi:hypothetical protein M422DRAFT_188879, partial [Sphaerobolus stellatus SS14]
MSLSSNASLSNQPRSQENKQLYKSNLGLVVEESAVDEAAILGNSKDVDHVAAERVRKKIDRHILPLMCVLYLIQYMDKATLGNAAVSNGRLQIIRSSLFFSNWLSSIFYFGYLVFEYPQSLALQRFPVAKWMALNVFSWGIILCSHAACTNFGGLFTVRLLLGVCEGSITPAFMLITSMFYTRQEQTKRVGYWRMLLIITGIITLILAVCVWFYFPDSPATAWFLSHEERIIAVQRLKVNQTGIGNKHFKREQYV